jgi:hypothetical protein
MPGRKVSAAISSSSSLAGALQQAATKLATTASSTAKLTVRSGSMTVSRTNDALLLLPLPEGGLSYKIREFLLLEATHV